MTFWVQPFYCESVSTTYVDAVGSSSCDVHNWFFSYQQVFKEMSDTFFQQKMSEGSINIATKTSNLIRCGKAADFSWNLSGLTRLIPNK